MSRPRAMPLWHFGGYRRFCGAWWLDLWHWTTRGWLYDLRTYWHRARYGWAPRDTWSLDNYLEGVLGGALVHLADNSHGCPACYPYEDAHVIDPSTGSPRPYRGGDDADTIINDHQQWEADLRRWAAAFAGNSEHDLFEEPRYSRETHGQRHEEIARRRQAAQDALREMAPWWVNLWE